MVIDANARKRNRGPEASRIGSKLSLLTLGREQAREEEEEECERAEAAEAAAAAAEGGPGPENYQTKPNPAENPDALLRHQQLLESADAVLKLSASLAPKREPSED